MRSLVVGLVLSATASIAPLAAQPPANRQPPGASLQVYLMTFGEGEVYWEKFGHNALWFRDPSRGIDAAYNWGMFDFGAPGFLWKLLAGTSQYWVEAYPGNALIDGYRRLDRTVTLQRLNLTPEQAQKALDFAQWNAREENKFYRYDYFRDNCSTRVRDVIDLAFGGAIKAATTSDTVPRSYRSETLRLVDDLKLTQFGINAALARPADRSLTTWENMFVPMRLRDALRAARVNGQPVVAEERVVYETTQHHERADAPRLAVPYLLVGLIIAAGVFALARVGRRSPGMDKSFRSLAMVWSFLTGLLGAILLLAWMITEHVFWYGNENLLLFNLLSLFLAVLAILSVWRPRWLRPAAICAAIVAVLSAAAMILKGLPGSQDNLPLILLVLPVHFAAAYGLWTRARDSDPASRPPRAA